MKLKDKIICITGAAGFIGSEICHRLCKESNIIALDYFSNRGREENLSDIKDEIEIAKVDIRNVDGISKYIKKSDAVIHLAAIDSRIHCLENFMDTFDVNIKGTLNILSSSSNLEKMVYASSVRVYGDAMYLPIDETHPLNGKDPYSTSKIVSEQLIKAYDYVYDIPYSIVRVSNTYGKRQDPYNLIPTFILEGMKDKMINIHNQQVMRDFLYIDDCADGFIRILKSDNTIKETLNLGTGKGNTTSDIANIISEYLNIPWVNHNKPLPLNPRLILDITKMKSLLHWEPSYDLRTGIENTIRWLQ